MDINNRSEWIRCPVCRNTIFLCVELTGGLQSKIDHKNEEIDILKIGLSGIAKRYGYQN